MLQIVMLRNICRDRDFLNVNKLLTTKNNHELGSKIKYIFKGDSLRHSNGVIMINRFICGHLDLNKVLSI